MRYAKAFDPPLHVQLLLLTSVMDVVQDQARNLWRAVSSAQLKLPSSPPYFTIMLWKEGPRLKFRVE